MKKKSVTFSDQVELVSCAEEIVEDFVPNPLLERVLKQHQEKVQEQLNSSMESIGSSSDSAALVAATAVNSSSTEFTCNLCHAKSVPANITYCPDCAFYMSRFQKAD